jgi:hypothetical protein
MAWEKGKSDLFQDLLAIDVASHAMQRDGQGRAMIYPT